jgi:FixJ family two-component response regulator
MNHIERRQGENGTVEMVEAGAPIFIVDDDAAVRDALMLLLRVEGFAPRCFADAGRFLDAIGAMTPACVILDLNLPGTPPLAILQQLAIQRFAAPVLVISGHSDIGLAVAAMKQGAADYLAKPFAAATIVARIRELVVEDRVNRADPLGGLGAFPGRDRLTHRECEVLAEVARGASNKEAGRRLRISPRTVEVHRARIMAKLGARNTADLMRIVLSEAGPRRYGLAGE